MQKKDFKGEIKDLDHLHGSEEITRVHPPEEGRSDAKVGALLTAVGREA